MHSWPHTALGRRGPGGSEQGLAERLATLEMKELNERQRADLAAARLKQAQVRPLYSYKYETLSRAKAIYYMFTITECLLSALIVGSY